MLHTKVKIVLLWDSYTKIHNIFNAFNDCLYVVPKNWCTNFNGAVIMFFTDASHGVKIMDENPHDARTYLRVPQ